MVNIRKSPAQDVYDRYFMLSRKMGYDTYDYLPPDKVKYPFVVMSSVEDNKNNTKTELTGSIVLTIDCWGIPKQRLTINEMVERFFYASVGHVNTESYSYYGQAQQQSTRILIDTSVPNSTLLHGIVTVELQIQ
ncbi:hypothetical protein GBP19_04015 [Pediococcus acidilactici]|uniref:hypothetical protein n=1 Tax=Pediococcus acidilactici TaxID=1254 RepID=UPI00132FB9F2|nr:hypothetical protein [Pediococcus acidilactici]KAF0500073.1 hypothetical protein GBP19_04015 [Pediococcus acidilactici]